MIPNYHLEIPRFNTSIINQNFNVSSSIPGIVNGFGAPTQFFTPSLFTPPSPSKAETKKVETWEEYQARIAKESEKAAEDEKKKNEDAEKKEMGTPLTESEKKVLKEETLKIDADNNKKAQGSLAAAMAFPALFSIPQLKAAVKPSTNTINMFYKDGAAHMEMFNKNPELMGNAQEVMRKLESKYLKDIKAVKGNRSAMKNLVQERDLFRDIMQKALDTNDAKEIAKATAQCQTAAGVKNGWFKRIIRHFKKQPEISSRFDAVATADSAKQFAADKIKVPNSGKSFFKNMFSSKLSTIMAASMLVMPFITGWKDIKEAKAVDKSNKENGKESHYGRKQITQTAVKGVSSFVAYNVVDTAVRTAFKRGLGKLAGRFAAKLAVKGGCKILGAAVGSVLPGLGNVLGIIAGAAFDFVLNKFVFGKMKFFNNSGIKEAQVESAKDSDLLSGLTEQYISGGDLSSKSVEIMKRKLGKEEFAELKRVHDMPEKERNEYIAKLQQAQLEQLQQLQEQQKANPTEKDVAVA